MFKRFFTVLFLLSLLGLFGSAQAQINTEVEPNDTCETAQDLTGADFPFSLSGLLHYDRDYFKFTATPGTLVAVDLEGVDQVAQNALGILNSGCNDYKPTPHLNHEVLIVPKDGVFIVAIFAPVRPSESFLYRLTITPTSAIGSISGVISDAITGRPLTSAVNTTVTFVNCKVTDIYDCMYNRSLASQATNNQGEFAVSREDDGTPLEVANYRIWVSADQYESVAIPFFAMAKDQHKQVNISLKPYPARLSISPCNNIPSAGGKCKFSVTVFNGQAKNLPAVIWNIVTGQGINTLGQTTQFPILPFPFVFLPKAGSKSFNFQFNVPAGVREGASICVDTFVGGLGKNPNFNIKGTSNFCISKMAGSNTLKVVPESEANRHLHRRNLKGSVALVK